MAGNSDIPVTSNKSQDRKIWYKIRDSPSATKFDFVMLVTMDQKVPHNHDHDNLTARSKLSVDGLIEKMIERKKPTQESSDRDQSNARSAICYGHLTFASC